MDMDKKNPARIILISGTGPGKSHIGKLLADDYKAKSIPCHCLFISEAVNLTIERMREEHTDGYVIIETNIPVNIKEIVKPWQHIVVA